MPYPHICRIEIENFRNLHGLAADLPPNAVIVGENRSGKSNLLHALRLVLDPSLPDTARQLRAEDFWDALPRPFAGSQITVRLFFRGIDGDEDAESTFAECIVADEPMTASLTYVYRPRATIEDAETATEADYEHLVYGGANETREVGRDVRRWLSATVLPAMRDAESQLQAARRPLLQPLIDRIRPLVDTATLATVRGELDASAEKLLAEPALQELQERINTRVREIVGEHQAVATKFAFAASDPEQLLRSLRLFLDEGKTRAIADASLGTANILFLALLLQDLDERRERHVSAGTILAIEEPEAHLHPHIQRLLFRYALRRSHSVLVTTHSPHIASVAPLSSLTLLQPASVDGAEGAHLRSALSLGLAADIVADLERYLDVTRAEMLFARGIIFVEGAAEVFLVPTFAGFQMQKRGLGSSLDELGITVCAVAGTDFMPYWTLTSSEGWSIPRVVITDGDPDERADVTFRRGLIRGAQLLDDKDLADAVRSGKEDRTFKALKAAGIFVGVRTLELDLVDPLGEEMKEAFADLFGSTRKATGRFKDSVDRLRAGDNTVAQELLDLIHLIGKGRYAQRLAAKVTVDHEPPAYIAKALARIFSLVQHA